LISGSNDSWVAGVVSKNKTENIEKIDNTNNDEFKNL
tara:strand:+ start:2871 stop:2981 length:111 start_codon:yes stop_codon:yes gene_type:complete